jgi:hypothetical protein
MVLKGGQAELEGSEGSEQLWIAHSCAFLVGSAVYVMHVCQVEAMIDVRRGMCIASSHGAKEGSTSACTNWY